MDAGWLAHCGSTPSLNSLASFAQEPSSPRSEGRPDLKTASGNCSSKVLASKDVDFADVIFAKIDAWPGHEIRITARDVCIQKRSVSELLEFIGGVLESADAAGGFGIIYDFRLLKNPSVKGLLAIASWASEPARQTIFKERCVACTACVPPGWKFYATRAAMAAFFHVTPPTCKTYLTTDFDQDKAKTAVFDLPGAKHQDVNGGRLLQRISEGSTGAPQGAKSRCLTGCFEWLACGQRRQLAEAHLRIKELEKVNLELKAALTELTGRMAKLEVAVPWAPTVAQLGLN